MGSLGNSSYELKSIISALFAGLLGVLRAVEEQQEAGVAVGFVGGVVVNAAGMGGGDVASGYATLCQFMGDVVGTGTAEGEVDGIGACGTVSCADDTDGEAIASGDACHLVEVDELGGVEEVGGAETEEEIDGGSYACLTRLNEREVIFV